MTSREDIRRGMGSSATRKPAAPTVRTVDIRSQAAAETSLMPTLVLPNARRIFAFVLFFIGSFAIGFGAGFGTGYASKECV